MSHSFAFQPVTWHDRLPSTNTWILDQVSHGSNLTDGMVVAARSQTAGRGRQQRQWHTAPGRNLTFSFLWTSALPPEHLPSMAQAISVGIVQFLAILGVGATIKWPNDVVVGGKKMGGILCETARRPNSGDTVVVAGIGLNINMNANEAARIDQPATSLALETDCAYAVEPLLDQLLGFLSPPLNAWGKEGFRGIEHTYAHLTVPPGTPICVRDGDRHTEGLLSGFTALGALRLVLENGTEKVIYTGDLFGL